MMSKTLNGHLSINRYVQAKLRSMPRGGMDFRQLFEMMFSEKNNVMFEYSTGYRITEVTYGECYQSILKKANALGKKLSHLPLQSVIGLYMENSMEWIEMFWAVLLCGFCPLLMNLRLDLHNLEKTLAASEAKAVIHTGENGFTVPGIRPEDLLQEEESIDEKPAGGRILLMSSGTSDHVKICAYNADAFREMLEDSYYIIRNCPQLKKHCRGKLKQLAFLPFYHIFGLIAVYIWFGFFSRTIVLLDNMSPKTIVNTIRRHQVTHIFAVPLFWNKVYEQAMQTIRQRGEKAEKKYQKGIKIADKIIGIPVIGKALCGLLFHEIRQNLFGNSIRFLISGGSEIKPEVLKFFNMIGYHIANGYGMTEIGITSVELSSNPRILNSASVGKPFSSVRYDVDSNGVLKVQSGHMACQIHDGTQWKPAGETWFSTGDVAREANGHWYILGRVDDLVISPNGENLNPNLIESRVSVKGIREICLIGVKDENNKVRPVLIANPVLTLSGGSLTDIRKDLIHAVRSEGLDKQISSIVFVKEPLTEKNDIKLNRKHIAERFQNGEFTILHPGTETANEALELKNRIRGLFSQVIGKPVEEIDDHMDFFLECGGSSLDYFSMVSQLQEEYGVPFPVAEGETLTTVNDLTDYLIRKVGHDA